MNVDRVINGDCLQVLKEIPDNSIDCCVTSPPYYGLRDYGMAEQIGLEETPEQYIQKLVDVFHEVKRCLKDDGTLWLNIGDSYAGSGKGRNADGTAWVKEGTKQATSKGTINGNLKRSGDGDAKPKDLIGIPWMLAFALRADGWYLRQDIIWHKPNPMPESVRDRCTKSHEYIFLMSKCQHYHFDHEAIQEDANPKSAERYKYEFNKGKCQKHFRPNGVTNNTEGLKRRTGKRNKRDVWSVVAKPTKEAHFATFPEELIKPCILAGCRQGGVVLDPFFGSGTTGRVAQMLNRRYLGIELNPEYIEISQRRNSNVQLSLTGIM